MKSSRLLHQALAAGAISVAVGTLTSGCLDAGEAVRKLSHTGGQANTSGEEIPASIDADGRIRVRDLGIDGFWYGFADRYGDTPLCTDVGRHLRDNCSDVTRPGEGSDDLNPNTLNVGWPKNEDGEMCVLVTVAKVQKCCNKKAHEESNEDDPAFDCQGSTDEERTNTFNCEDKVGWDYTNMWGGGIGFDFRLDASAGDERSGELLTGGARKTWSAQGSDYRVVGLRFDFDWKGIEAEPQRIRVEFPMAFPDRTLTAGDRGMVRLDGSLLYPGERASLPGFSTDEHINGSPFAQNSDERQEAGTWGYTALTQGENEILFERDLRAPPASDNRYWPLNQQVPTDQVFGVQFHAVPPDPDRLQDLENRNRYVHFCISDLRFLVDRDPDHGIGNGGEGAR